ncbi:MAG: PDZ domain-containing protein [Pirellulales bacterium]
MIKPFGIFLTILLSLNSSVGGQEPAPVEKPSQTNQAASAWLNSGYATNSVPGETVAFVRVPYLSSLFVQENPLGIVVEPLAPELAAQLQIKPQGLVVTDVNDGSLAATAGLKRFDILLKAGESELQTPEDLKSLNTYQPGVSWEFLVRRAGKDLVVPLQVARDSNLPVVYDLNTYRQPVTTTKQYRIGVVLASVDDVLRSQIPILKESGVLITDVKSDSPADKVGIEKNDIILEIHGQPVDSEQNVRNQIQGTGEKEVTLKLLRRGKAIEVKVQPTVVEEPLEVVNTLTNDIFVIDVHNAQALPRNIYYNYLRSGSTAESELGEIKTLLKQLSEKVDALQAKDREK